MLQTIVFGSSPLAMAASSVHFSILAANSQRLSSEMFVQAFANFLAISMAWSLPGCSIFANSTAPSIDTLLSLIWNRSNGPIYSLELKLYVDIDLLTTPIISPMQADIHLPAGDVGCSRLTISWTSASEPPSLALHSFNNCTSMAFFSSSLIA